MGTRRTVIQAIEDLGGEVVLKNVRMDTHYLVIGDIGSAAWMHSPMGERSKRQLSCESAGRGLLLYLRRISWRVCTHFLRNSKYPGWRLLFVLT